MKNPGLKDYRLNSMEEPTDEQLNALMEKVAQRMLVSSRSMPRKPWSV